MAEDLSTTPAATVTPTAEPLGNDPTARATDGTILDNSATQPITTPQPTETPSEPVTRPTVPEKYEFVAPAGTELDGKFIERATPIFKELGLDNAAAQKLVDLANANAVAQSDIAVEAVNKMRGEWRGQVEVALEAKGEALTAKLAPIGKMKDVLFAGDKPGREAFDAAMDLTGAGDHPAIIQSMLKMAAKYNEGTAVTGGGPSAHGQRPGADAPKSAAQQMYPNLPSSNRAA